MRSHRLSLGYSSRHCERGWIELRLERWKKDRRLFYTGLKVSIALFCLLDIELRQRHALLCLWLLNNIAVTGSIAGS